MGPVRQAQLESPDDVERMRQETDALLATSQRLLAELEEMVANAAEIAKRQTTYVKSQKRKG
ncbi:MAG TPA: hypothetical protein VFJ70_04810 [Burkholderiales bacterium]|nr:hypothetical protein [Burkholderiales bacterium]